MSSLHLDLTTLPTSIRSTLAQQARAAHQSLQERAAAALIEAVGRPRAVDPVGLTPNQAELLSFIGARLRATGISPSFEEMMEALGLKSKSGVHRLIQGLEERGRIRRLHNRARAIEVVGGVR